MTESQFWNLDLHVLARRRATSYSETKEYAWLRKIKVYKAVVAASFAKGPQGINGLPERIRTDDCRKLIESGDSVRVRAGVPGVSVTSSRQPLYQVRIAGYPDRALHPRLQI